jgi:hypothetical protein
MMPVSAASKTWPGAGKTGPSSRIEPIKETADSGLFNGAGAETDILTEESQNKCKASEAASASANIRLPVISPVS